MDHTRSLLSVLGALTLLLCFLVRDANSIDPRDARVREFRDRLAAMRANPGSAAGWGLREQRERGNNQPQQYFRQQRDFSAMDRKRQNALNAEGACRNAHCGPGWTCRPDMQDLRSFSCVEVEGRGQNKPKKSG